MEKWNIKPAPTTFDPLRHVLLINGSMDDVSALLRRFGPLCGRPSKVKTPDGFNFSLPLHGVTTATMERLSAALNEMSGVSTMKSTLPLPPLNLEALSPASAPAPSSSPDAPGLPPLPELTPPSGGPPLPELPELVPLSPGPAAAPPPFAEPVAVPPPAADSPSPFAASPPPVDVPGLPKLPAAGPAMAPAPDMGLTSAFPAAPPPISASPPPAAAPSLFAAAPPPMATPPPAAAPPPVTKTPAPIPAAAPPVTAAPKPAAAPPTTASQAVVLPVRFTLDPQQTFDTLLVGPYDRFAHAAATSVVSSPGSMYNPLFLYGAPGVGKTHFMHSIAKGLAGPLGEGSVMLTSGTRLSFAVTRALNTRTFAGIKEELGKAKALVVDDVHLTAVTETNRAALVEIFARFFSNNLQVVFSSLYPARALGGLEEALRISLAKGWAVDLKVPNSLVQIEIIQNWLDKRGCQLNNDETRMFHERLGTAYPDALRWMRRLVKLNAALSLGGSSPKMSDVLNILFDPGVAATDFPVEAELAAAKNFTPPAPAAGAVPLALVLPKGHENMSGWIAKSFYQAASKYGIQQTYRHVLLQIYDASQPFGVPFQIADACSRAGARAALVIGPPNETPLAAKAAEFSHAVVHVLNSLGVASGWIAHRGGMAPAPYLRAHLDLTETTP